MLAKYIEERFPEWFLVPGGRDTRDNAIVDDGASMFAGVNPEDADELIARHNSAVRMIHKLVALAEKSAPEEFKALWYGETK